MKTKFIVLFAIFTIFTNNLLAQSPSGMRNIPPDTSGEAKAGLILTDAGRYFRQGLLNLQDNRRPQARADFDKSIEIFLLSNIDVRKNNRLNTCYNQLIETIYRMEFPTTSQTPQIRSLSATCSWNIENDLADKVAQMSVPVQNNPVLNTDSNQLVSSVIESNKQTTTGFSEQEFEPAIGEELAKIEFTQEEIVDESNPEMVQRIETETKYVQVAVNRGSFGFNFTFNPLVQQYLNYYQGRGRSTMETGLYRSGFFTQMARKIFREEGVPENIVWLGQVESAWKPTAKSWAAAAGLWQFIPGTGTRYGLRINGYLDERSSFEKATRASARYLKFLANRYNGNWELAMGAYNCGEGNVDRAIRKAGVASFWSAYPYLPRETRNYVPNILAVILVANNPTKYGFGNVRPAAPLQYDEIRVPALTNLGLIAQASDTTVDYLRYLNPEFRQGVTPPEPYIVRIPAGKAQKAFAVLKKIPSRNMGNTTIANVSAGENLQNIANRTGVPAAQIQTANAGSPTNGKVVVPNSKVQKTNYSRPTTATPSPTTTGVRTVKAQNGDTVAKIAARNGVSAIEVAKFNGLSSVDAPLTAGREIKLPPR
ncbi:MAG: transglycosylase SLT domain-containing protein [Pyrinomonadaceae bacterium]|jgi:membrane-bound lytic murein transglycosylase D|nr:transglycosylase SLT domain-containing protein [Pyrinomonadaceae bacterium]